MTAIGHCIAGGCASVATSVVYTPSECIKQNMQVGNYKNGFAALVGILREGGLRRLYGGWGAVLLRNVPQSVIKFLTYEQLKLAAINASYDGTLSTQQTLAFGGASATTASFFTTPMDVIKTRLQTQAFDPTKARLGVFGMLHHILRTEGVTGLYRGLTPRLLIYISQGAIFFGSYEFLKGALP